jgi:hypothetical protein
MIRADADDSRSEQLDIDQGDRVMVARHLIALG